MTLERARRGQRVAAAGAGVVEEERVRLPVPPQRPQHEADDLTRLFVGTPLTLWGATDTGRARSRRLFARGCHIVCFVELHPRKLDQRIQRMPVIHPYEFPRCDSHVLSRAAAQDAPDDICAGFQAGGFAELEHFTCVA